MAQAQGKEIIKRSPWVDIVVGPQSYQNLPELIAKVDPINKLKTLILTSQLFQNLTS